MSVWRSELAVFKASWLHNGPSLSLLVGFTRSWLSYVYYSTYFGTLERGMDIGARLRKVGLWFNGFRKGGLHAASQEMAGLKTTA